MTNSRKLSVLIGAAVAIVLVIAGWRFFKKPVSTSPKRPSLTVSGVGLYLGRNQDTRKFEVKRVFPNSPADKAGIAPGFVLNRVNDALAETNSIKDLSALLMGPVGSKVTLEVIDTNGLTKQLELLRQPFVNRSKQPSVNQ